MHKAVNAPRNHVGVVPVAENRKQARLNCQALKENKKK
jgi:hypothetical protein